MNGSVYIGYDNRYRVSSFSDPFYYGISYNYDTVGNRTKLKVNGATYAGGAPSWRGVYSRCVTHIRHHKMVTSGRNDVKIAKIASSLTEFGQSLISPQ